MKMQTFVKDILIILSVHVSTVDMRSLTFALCPSREADLSTVLETRKADSRSQCGVMCAENEYCQSANYQKHNKMCFMSDQVLLNQECNMMTENQDVDSIFVHHVCHYNMPVVNGKCQCLAGYLGTYCEKKAGDCVAYTSTGLHVIHPYKNTDGNGIKVYCSENGIRIFRGNGDDFPVMVSANWNSFHNGFGHPNDDEYWIGNKYIHEIMSDTAHTYELVFTVTNQHSSAFWQYYKDARITNKADNYTLHYGYATGVMDPLDMLPNHSPFRTFDHNDNGCVAMHGAAFWYSANCTVPSVMSGNYSWAGVIQSIRSFNGYINVMN